MDIDSYNFFLIILGGFFAVWSYRKTSRWKRDITDFEYLGFSAFWGLLLMGLMAISSNIQNKDFGVILESPYITGSILSFGGVIIGTFTARVVNWVFRDSYKS